MKDGTWHKFITSYIMHEDGGKIYFLRKLMYGHAYMELMREILGSLRISQEPP